MALGYPHPRHLLAVLTSRELGEWIAYYGLEPFGEERADLRAGIIASTVANVHRDSKSSAMTPKDFMPEFDYEPPSREEVAEKVRRMLHGPLPGPPPQAGEGDS